jgi:hypothetical protein
MTSIECNDCSSISDVFPSLKIWYLYLVAEAFFPRNWTELALVQTCPTHFSVSLHVEQTGRVISTSSCMAGCTIPSSAIQRRVVW